jgi:hypothetical protein
MGGGAANAPSKANIVRRVQPSRHVRYASNTNRIDASHRNVAMCQKSGLMHYNKIAPGGVVTHSRHGEMVRLARFELATFAVSRRRSPAEFKGAVWFAGNSPDMN